MNSGVRFRLAAAGDRPGLEALFDAVYGDQAPLRTSSWRYLGREGDDALISVAETAGRIVGAQPSHAVELQIESRRIEGALFLDAMTHPAHRRTGIFSGVVETLRTAWHARGARVLLTTPNPASAPAFARFPAWRALGEMTPFVLPLDLLRLARVLLPARMSGPTSGAAGARKAGPGASFPSADASIAPLCAAFADAAPCMVRRTPAALRWRFTSGPTAYAAFVDDIAGAPRGLAVSAIRPILGQPLTMLVEILVDPGRPRSGEEVLRMVRREAVQACSAAVLAYLSPASPMIPVLRRAGYTRVPPLLRPRAYSVWMSTDLDPSSAAAAADFGRWHMTPADSDLV